MYIFKNVNHLLVRLLLAAVITAGLLFSQTISLWGEGASCQISINAPAKVKTGSDFTASLDIIGLQKMDAADFNITFDPGVLRLDKVSAGQIDNTTVPVDIWNSTAPGVCKIVLNIPNVKGVGGSGYLALLQFHTIGTSGKSSLIQVENLTISSIEAERIAADCTNTSVLIEASSNSGSTGGGSSGGGGGSVTTPAPSLSLKGWGSSSPPVINSQGVVQKAAQLTSLDSKVNVNISSGTRMLTADNKTLTTLTSSELIDPPAPVPGYAIVLACSLGPEGAHFDPPLTISLSYDGIAPADNSTSLELDIFYFNGSAWQSLSGTIDKQARTVSAKISHFSNYALMSKVPKTAVLPTATAIGDPAPTPTSLTSGATPAVISSPTPLTASGTPSPTTTALPEATTPATPASSQTAAGSKFNWSFFGVATVCLAIVLIIAVIMARRKKS